MKQWVTWITLGLGALGVIWTLVVMIVTHLHNKAWVKIFENDETGRDKI